MFRELIQRLLIEKEIPLCFGQSQLAMKVITDDFYYYHNHAYLFSYLAIVNYLLSQHAMIDKQDNNGNNALHLSLLHSHLSCAKLLLKECPELIIQQNRQNQTPLNVLNSALCSRNMTNVNNNIHFAPPFLNEFNDFSVSPFQNSLRKKNTNFENYSTKLSLPFVPLSFTILIAFFMFHAPTVVKEPTHGKLLPVWTLFWMNCKQI